MHYAKEQILEAFKNLPEDVKEAIFSVETADILRQIGDGKNMMIDKIGEMADETGLVMLGFTHPSQFVSHLAERLGIEKSVAKEIAEEVNTRIFFPIRENLKKIHGLRAEEEGLSKDRPLEIPKDGPWEAPTPPTPSLLPSALMPEPVVLETTMPVQPVPVEPETTTPPSPISIFEAKTKEGVLRLPAEVTEKKAEETKKVDPYREPTI